MTAPQTNPLEIGWIGVGKMGNPMATRLIEAGHKLTICDPVVENRASLVARGAQVSAIGGRCGGKLFPDFCHHPK